MADENTKNEGDGYWNALWKGWGNGSRAVVRTVIFAASTPVILSDKITGRTDADKVFKFADDIDAPAQDAYKLKEGTGRGQRIVSNIAGVAPVLMVSGGNPTAAAALGGATATVDTGSSLIQQGVDLRTSQVAAVTAGATSVIPLSFLGKGGVTQQITKVALANAGLGTANQAFTQTMLEQRGYGNVSKNYPALTDTFIDSAATGLVMGRVLTRAPKTPPAAAKIPPVQIETPSGTHSASTSTKQPVQAAADQSTPVKSSGTSATQKTASTAKANHTAEPDAGNASQTAAGESPNTTTTSTTAAVAGAEGSKPNPTVVPKPDVKAQGETPASSTSTNSNNTSHTVDHTPISKTAILNDEQNSIAQMLVFQKVNELKPVEQSLIRQLDVENISAKKNQTTSQTLVDAFQQKLDGQGFKFEKIIDPDGIAALKIVDAPGALGLQLRSLPKDAPGLAYAPVHLKLEGATSPQGAAQYSSKSHLIETDAGALNKMMMGDNSILNHEVLHGQTEHSKRIGDTENPYFGTVFFDAHVVNPRLPKGYQDTYHVDEVLTHSKQTDDHLALYEQAINNKEKNDFKKTMAFLDQTFLDQGHQIIEADLGNTRAFANATKEQTQQMSHLLTKEKMGAMTQMDNDGNIGYQFPVTDKSGKELGNIEYFKYGEPERWNAIMTKYAHDAKGNVKEDASQALWVNLNKLDPNVPFNPQQAHTELNTYLDKMGKAADAALERTQQQIARLDNLNLRQKQISEEPTQNPAKPTGLPIPKENNLTPKPDVEVKKVTTSVESPPPADTIADLNRQHVNKEIDDFDYNRLMKEAIIKGAGLTEGEPFTVRNINAVFLPEITNNPHQLLNVLNNPATRDAGLQLIHHVGSGTVKASQYSKALGELELVGPLQPPVTLDTTAFQPKKPIVTSPGQTPDFAPTSSQSNSTAGKIGPLTQQYFAEPSHTKRKQALPEVAREMRRYLDREGVGASFKNVPDAELPNILRGNSQQLLDNLKSNNPFVVDNTKHLMQQYIEHGAHPNGLNGFQYQAALNEMPKLAKLPEVADVWENHMQPTAMFGRVYDGKLNGRPVVATTESSGFAADNMAVDTAKALEAYGGPKSLGNELRVIGRYGIPERVAVTEKIEGMPLGVVLANLRQGKRTDFPITDQHIQAVDRLAKSLEANGQHLENIQANNFILTPDGKIAPVGFMRLGEGRAQDPTKIFVKEYGEPSKSLHDLVSEAHVKSQKINQSFIQGAVETVKDAFGLHGAKAQTPAQVTNNNTDNVAMPATITRFPTIPSVSDIELSRLEAQRTSPFSSLQTQNPIHLAERPSHFDVHAPNPNSILGQIADVHKIGQLPADLPVYYKGDNAPKTGAVEGLNPYDYGLPHAKVLDGLEFRLNKPEGFLGDYRQTTLGELMLQAGPDAVLHQKAAGDSLAAEPTTLAVLHPRFNTQGRLDNPNLSAIQTPEAALSWSMSLLEHVQQTGQKPTPGSTGEKLLQAIQQKVEASTIDKNLAGYPRFSDESRLGGQLLGVMQQLETASLAPTQTNSNQKIATQQTEVAQTPNLPAQDPTSSTLADMAKQFPAGGSTPNSHNQR